MSMDLFYDRNFFLILNNYSVGPPCWRDPLNCITISSSPTTGNMLTYECCRSSNHGSIQMALKKTITNLFMTTLTK